MTSAVPYEPPLGEAMFVLDKVLDWRRLFALPAFGHADAELAAAILKEGARFSADILAPLNSAGDVEGSRLVDGRVVTPAGFREAYRAFVDAGWAGVDLPQKHGGQALPLTVQVAFAEMVNGSCVSFGMLPIMLRAAAWLLMEHADRDLIARVVPRLVCGEWAATICISEPQAGSDVGRIRTRAVGQPDGRYRLSGTKIFISYGDHDLTDQIVHMVLARTAGAPDGTGGLSLFAVPKLQFDDSARNGVSVSRVEKKMGLKASPTCVLDLDDAVGYRVGAECQGLACMFTMVNLMRLEVSIQGVALAGAATSKALRYAAGRPQGGDPAFAPVPIIQHADVRRMLLIMRARTEAMRALVFETALNLDLSRAAEAEHERRTARALAQFLLPVCKTCGAEAGFEVASLAVQVLGGHGYVSDAGVEQYLRDSRVMSIYEGTSGIQALDLLTRKVLKDGGARYRIFTQRVRRDLDVQPYAGDIREVRDGLGEALGILDACTGFLAGGHGPRDVEAAATDYLHLTGLVACAWMWLRIAAASNTGSEADHRRCTLARFFARHLLPAAAEHRKRIEAGSKLLDAIDAQVLTGWD